MQRRTAIITFIGFLAAAAAVVGLTASGAVNFQALDKLGPHARSLFFPDGGLISVTAPAPPPPPVPLSPPADAGRATARPDAGLKLKLAPGEAERADAGADRESLLSAAMTFAQSTCTLNGKVTMKDGSSPEGRVVVYVEQVPPDTGQRDRRAEAITIHKNHFEPALLAVVKDDSIRFLNPEAGEHSVFSPSGANEFRLGPKKDTLLGTKILGVRGAVHLQCDLDEALSADVLVLPNAFFALAGPGGAWRIDGLPKGERNVTAWEPNGGTASQLVKCAGETTAALTLDPHPPLQRKHLDGTPYK